MNLVPNHPWIYNKQNSDGTYPDTLEFFNREIKPIEPEPKYKIIPQDDGWFGIFDTTCKRYLGYERTLKRAKAFVDKLDR